MDKILVKLRKKIYFVPMIYSVVSIVFALFVIWIDINYVTNITRFSKFLLTDIGLGKSIFTALVGALLTMITVTFSTMMVVLTLYSSQMSPRSMQDFLEQRFIVHILGFMSGVFVFSLISLFAMKDLNEGRLSLSPFIGIIAAILTISAFILFIHKVSQSMRVNIYIQSLTDENLELINNKYLKNIKDNGITNVKPKDFEDNLKDEPLQVMAKKSGFIQLYEETKLWQYVLDNDLLIVCENRIGEFVLEDAVLFSIHVYNEEFERNIEKEAEKLLGCVLIGDDSNKNADIEAGLIKLSEIGVKALSSGINDPNTAYYCIENLGFLLSRIGMQFDQQFFLNEDNQAVLIVENTAFVDLLYKVFYQLRLYGQNDYLVIGAIIDALGRIAEANNYEVKMRIWRFAKYVLEGLVADNMKSLDKSYLNRRIYLLSRQTNQNPKELAL